jgi:RNA polymerase sigma factor (sigma-70 family)
MDLGQSRQDLEQFYAAHKLHVRRCLATFGVAPADLDDVVQEAFLVVHDKREELPRVTYPDAWLREICRRVAAAYRRRAYRRREVSVDNPPELVESALKLDVTSHEKREDEERLHRALGALDDESRDLIALHSGDLPLADIAKLINKDRKTTRKRLQTALRRLGLLFFRTDSGERSKHLIVPSRPSVTEIESDPQAMCADELQVLLSKPALTVGLIGTVVIAVWRVAATLEALEDLQRQVMKVLASYPGGFAYWAIVEASTHPPKVETRKKIVKYLQLHARDIRIYATSLHGGLSRIVQPLMKALSLLARPPFPMEFFSGNLSAARWLSTHDEGAAKIGLGALVRAAERLRAQAVAPQDRAGSAGLRS